VVDEIGNAAEAEALQGVGHRGACIIGTAHGNTIHDVLKNPELSLLLGGLAEVTVGDWAARSLPPSPPLPPLGSPSQPRTSVSGAEIHF